MTTNNEPQRIDGHVTAKLVALAVARIALVLHLYEQAVPAKQFSILWLRWALAWLIVRRRIRQTA